MFLLNSRLGLFTVTSKGFNVKYTPFEAPLLPKLRGEIAEFLNEGYFEHLGIFSLSTCVGLRYEQLINLQNSYFSAVWL